MGCVLLVVASGRHSTEAFHFALHKAKETGRQLKIVYVVESPEGDGKEPQRALSEIDKQCRSFQIPFESTLREGAYLKVCEEIVLQEGADLLVITEKKEGFLKKWVEGSDLSGLKDRLPCEIKAYPAE